ncbi:MAG: flagellar basal body P-ring formation protein FlgA [Gammaproteobacteria bacterium]|nr:flagellar basal body P-ring formation protein FlgA [Gammaproteobacteria bacterium]
MASRLQHIFGITLLICGLSAPAGATTEPIQVHADILAAGRSFLLDAARAQHDGDVEVRMGRLDPRLRLARCTQPLQGFLPPGARLSGSASVGVRCPGAAGWTLYIKAHIAVLAPALVTTRPIARAATLSAADVQVVERDVSASGYGYLQNLDQIDGMIARRLLPAGTLLNPTMVKAPRLIRRGDRVTLINAAGPIQVEMVAEAISDGTQGERIRVRALNSGRVIDAWVVSAGVVKLTL